MLASIARLAGRGDPVEMQSQLAHGIAWDHVACPIAIIAFVALQLWTDRASARAR